MFRVLRFFCCLALSAAITIVAESGAAEREEQPAGASPGFFRLKEWLPVPLREALRAYEQGRFFAALGSLDELIASRRPAYALDDARFLRALSFSALGWDDLAVPSLTAVIEADPTGPYSVTTIRELVEIHDRAGRWKAVADNWGRFVDRPLSSKGSKNERIGELLFAFGTLRAPSTSSTRREKSLLSRPKELAVLLEDRRERQSDRLLYRSGLALARLGRHEESLRPLLMIGLESPYYPYARYSIAQNFFALGRSSDAITTLTRLERYPKITPEERALESRARVLHAAILFESGDVDAGIGIARSIDDDDPEAPEARLLITTALLDAGKPALALVYDTATAPPLAGAEARRALTMGVAYASLGDRGSAAKVLRAAVGRIRESRLAGASLDEAVERVRHTAEDLVRDGREREQRMRAHLASGMHIILAHDGPWNLGTMLRRVRAVLGAGAYRELALGTKPQPAKTVSDGAPWLAYLTSSRRSTIELALARLLDLEPAAGESRAESSLRIVNGYLLVFERAPLDDGRRRQVAARIATLADELRSRSGRELPPLRLDPAAPPMPELTAFRRRLAENADALSAAEAGGDSLAAARDEAASLLRSWIDRELREMFRERDVELRDLELDLDVALAEALSGETRAGDDARPQ